MIDLAGLDSGAILLRDPGTWKVVALKRRPGLLCPEDDWRASRQILDLIEKEKRTFFRSPEGSEFLGSLRGVEAVVAAPILNSRGDVIATLYGDRYQAPRAALPQHQPCRRDSRRNLGHQRRFGVGPAGAGEGGRGGRSAFRAILQPRVVAATCRRARSAARTRRRSQHPVLRHPGFQHGDRKTGRGRYGRMDQRRAGRAVGLRDRPRRRAGRLHRRRTDGDVGARRRRSKTMPNSLARRRSTCSIICRR